MAIRIVNAKMEKGKLYLTTDTNKNIVVDVNAGVIYGVSGKALKTCPAYRALMRDYDTDKLRDVGFFPKSQGSEKLAERLV